METVYRRLTQQYLWLIIFALVIVFAAIPRFLTFDFSLPFIEHADEPAFYIQSLIQRGLFETDTYILFEGYPPFYLALQQYIVQPLVEHFGRGGPASTIYWLRFVAALLNIATMALIMASAKYIANNLAALLAGITWAISPIILTEGIYAIPDPFVYFFTALTLFLAIHAWHTKTNQILWLIAAFVAAGLAFLTKYTVAGIFVPTLLVLQMVIRRERHHIGRRFVILSGIVVTIFGVIAATYIYRILSLTSSAAFQRYLLGIVDFNRIVRNVNYALSPLGGWYLYGLLVASAIAWFFAKPETRFKPKGIVLLLSAWFFIPWSASVFGDAQQLGRVRDVLPATTAICILVGVAYAQIIVLFPKKIVRYGILLGLIALLSVPVYQYQIRRNIVIIQDRVKPDNRVQVRQWFDENHTADYVLVNPSYDKVFNEMWGGIPAYNNVLWWGATQPDDKTVTEWRELGIDYAILSQPQVNNLDDAYLNQLLPIKYFDDDNRRGGEAIVYRLWRMEQELSVMFGDVIELTGYDISSERADAGETVTLQFYWQAQQQPDRNYLYFLHLTPLDDWTQTIIQSDGNPAPNQRLTRLWDDPDETIISSPINLTIPQDLPEGTYQLVLGLYDMDTFVRLPVDAPQAQGDGYPLTQITIGQP